MNTPQLHADIENVEGIVSFPALWRDLPALVRADLLKDWLFELQSEYEFAVRDIWPDSRAGSAH
jgi:hypothetical protein